MERLNVGSEAVYDYTFNAKMVGCSVIPQNFSFMLDEWTPDPKFPDYTKVWSRENYDHEDCKSGSDPFLNSFKGNTSLDFIL